MLGGAVFIAIAEGDAPAAAALTLLSALANALIRSVARRESPAARSGHSYYATVAAEAGVAIAGTTIGYFAGRAGRTDGAVIFFAFAAFIGAFAIRSLAYVESRDALAREFEDDRPDVVWVYACGRLGGFTGWFRPCALVATDGERLEIFSARLAGAKKLAGTSAPSIRVIEPAAPPKTGVAEFDFGDRKVVVGALVRVELEALLKRVGAKGFDG